MKEFVGLLVLLAAGGGAYALWRRYNYPGDWAHAFHPRHAADRDDLDKARRPARDLAREREKELAAAHAGIERADRRHRAVVRSIEQEIHHLRHPGRGQEVAELGGLTLHQHAVIKDDREIPLQGLAIHHEHAQQQDFIHLAPTDGDPCHTSYPHAAYDPDDVRRFAMRLESAVADERSHQGRTTKLVTQKQEELTEAQADTSLHDDARAHLTDVTSRQRQAPPPHAAQSELNAAHDRWHISPANAPTEASSV
jgi:hypothetical protein